MKKRARRGRSPRRAALSHPGRCLTTITNINRLGCALAGAAAALLLWLALPLSAKAADYDTTLSRLDELQTLAESYIAEQNNGADPMLLTLSYTRGGGYNDSIWQLTAGAKDSDFESYVRDRDESLGELVGMGSITVGNGDTVDFGHLLASINLVYNGVPITGSWGGDCMELAQQYSGQASDAAGYVTLMQESFGAEGDGSVFGADDLRADLDSVNIGSQLSQDTNLADLMRTYYADLNDHDRCYTFAALSFGNVNTGNTEKFRETVYDSLVKDTGMQLLLYMNGMWTSDGWTLSSEYEPALQGAAYVFADYLSETLGGEEVKTDSNALKVMSSESLAEALNALGESDAANAALSALDNAGDTSSGAVSDALDNATENLRSSFNAQAFQLVLLVIAAAALFGLILFLALMSQQLRPRRR